MGTPDYAEEILKALIEDTNIDLIAVFTQPDKPVGRKAILTPPPVKVLAESNNIPVYQPEKLRNPENVELIKKLKPDFIVVAAYGQILSKEILETAPCINLHASLLPKYRGASPIQSSLLNEDKFTGVTAMLMNEGLDTGNMLSFSIFEINKQDNLETLYVKLTEEAKNLTIETIRSFSYLRGLKQNDLETSYSPKIAKNDGLIEFDNAKNINSKFKAFYSWPSIFLQSGFKITQMELKSEDGHFNRGEILEIHKNYALIGCETGSIKITEVQPKSKKKMKIFDYLNGKRLQVGDILS
jgi:methionyl-tRNA formyltransferase